MKEFVGLRAKRQSYLKDNNDEKGKGTKKCAIKRKLKFQDYKTCKDPAQIERKINYLRKKIIEDQTEEDKKQFVKNKKLILKTQLRFKSERQNILTEEINKAALSSNECNQLT